MRKLLNKVFILVSIFILNLSFVYAIDCEYLNGDLVISYDSNTNVSINYDKFKNSKNFNFFFLSSSTSFYSSEEVNIDQSLVKKYQGVSCPTSMYVCEVATISLNAPSLPSLFNTIEGASEGLNCLFNSMFDISGGGCENLSNEDFMKLGVLNSKTLNILTVEEYEESEMSLLEDGAISGSLAEGFNAGYNFCNFSDGKVSNIVGSICGTVSSLANGAISTIFDKNNDVFGYTKANCQVVDYTGEYNSIDINCSGFVSLFYLYNEKIETYKQCENSNCKSSIISDLNSLELKAKNYCQQILSNYDFTDLQKGCIKDCLEINSTLNKFKIGTDLYNSSSNISECGFSDKLVIWISNIIRWIKYIIPIVVIILGILDFIKALSSDKDDEMKKAQGRFVKRLIAAALIFLVPLIVEFVLDKMGFISNGCGIIDL